MKKTLALAVVMVLAICMLASVTVLADEIKVMEAPVDGKIVTIVPDESVPDDEEKIDNAIPDPELKEEKIVVSPAPVSRSTDGFAPMPEKELSVSDIFVAVFCVILLILTGIYFYIMYKREMEKEAIKKEEQPEQQEEAKTEE